MAKHGRERRPIIPAGEAQPREGGGEPPDSRSVSSLGCRSNPIGGLGAGANPDQLDHLTQHSSHHGHVDAVLESRFKHASGGPEFALDRSANTQLEIVKARIAGIGPAGGQLFENAREHDQPISREFVEQTRQFARADMVGQLGKRAPTVDQTQQPSRRRRQAGDRRRGVVGVVGSGIDQTGIEWLSHWQPLSQLAQQQLLEAG
jgi:hypothetical protein